MFSIVRGNCIRSNLASRVCSVFDIYDDLSTYFVVSGQVSVQVVRSMATDLTIREAINLGLDEEMARDEKVFLIGSLAYLSQSSEPESCRSRRRRSRSISRRLQGHQRIVSEVRSQASD